MHIVFTIIVAVVLGKWIIDRNKRKKEEAEASAGKPSEADHLRNLLPTNLHAPLRTSSRL